jgi:two-component system sensor histidine kinase AlgZ
MRQSSGNSRPPSFWSVQLTGWSVYMAVNIVSSIPYRSQPEFMAYCAFRGALFLTAFLGSFAMYGICHWLWLKQVSMLRVVTACVLTSYPLGVLGGAASFWSEIHLGGVPRPLNWSSVFAAAPGGSFILIAWSALYFAIKHYFALEQKSKQLVASELLAAEAQSMAREMQLRALRYQLQPHFLFNTLNAISTLVLDNQPRVATQMISHLASLLRSTLDSPDRDIISLAEEIAVTEQYLAIEEVRFGSRLKVRLDLDHEAMQTQVPRLLLQPLVENAIRHGIAKRAEGGNIAICATTCDAELSVRITNELPELPSATTYNGNKQWGGLGLVNVRKRLEQSFGVQGKLSTRNTPDGLFEVIISIPLSLAPLHSIHQSIPELFRK